MTSRVLINALNFFSKIKQYFKYFIYKESIKLKCPGKGNNSVKFI